MEKKSPVIHPFSLSICRLYNKITLKQVNKAYFSHPDYVSVSQLSSAGPIKQVIFSEGVAASQVTVAHWFPPNSFFFQGFCLTGVFQSFWAAHLRQL